MSKLKQYILHAFTLRSHMSFVNIYLNNDQLNSGEGGGDTLLVSFL